MAEQYKIDREKREKVSRVTGIILTAAAHAGLLVCCVVSGFTYLDPPPPERELFVIDFDAVEVQKPKQVWNGTSARAVDPDPTQLTSLVQKSEAQHEGTKSNEAPEAQVDDFGDVDITDPEPKKEIDRRALFRTAKNNTNKDTLAHQTAEKASDDLKAGHALGNTLTGETSGQPNAKLEGRELRGTIPKPQYTVQKAGRVVVTISVDRNGDVITAQPGAEGTNVTDSELWKAARMAALETHFNICADAPEKQYGTITYIFNLE